MLTRSEALREIEQTTGNTEETGWLVDWIQDLWETEDELYKRLPPALAHAIIHAQTPLFDKEGGCYVRKA